MRPDAKLITFCFLLATTPAIACGRGGEEAGVPEHESDEVAQNEQGTGHEGHEGMPGMPGMEGATQPARGGSAWTELKETRDSIAQVIESGKLAEVHEKSERLEPIGQALADGAKSLPEEKRTRIEATLRQIPELATALHVAADAGNADATRRALKRLDGLLALIQVQYPADVLDQVPAPVDAQGEHPHSESEPVGHEHGGHMHATPPLAAADDAPKATLRVKADEFEFEPTSFVMKAGEPTRIELENEGAIEHALIVAAPDGKGDWIHLHAMAKATDSGTFRIDQPGKYPPLGLGPDAAVAALRARFAVSSSFWSY